MTNAQEPAGAVPANANERELIVHAHIAFYRCVFLCCVRVDWLNTFILSVAPGRKLHTWELAE